MILRKTPFAAVVALILLLSPWAIRTAQAIVYRSDSNLTTAQQLADQPQFSGTGIVALSGDSGTGTVIDAHWVLTAKHVVTAEGTITPAANAVTFYYAGGNMKSTAIYSDPNSDLALVYFAAELPSSLAVITPNLSLAAANPVGAQIWNVGYGSYGPYPGTSLTNNAGSRLAGTNIVTSRTTVSGLSGNFLNFSNQNTTGTEFESSTAPGDSGGPMFFQNGYQWLVAGAVFGAANGVGFIDTDTTTDSFITSTTGLSFTPRAQAASVFWTSSYLNNASGSNKLTLKTATDGGGTWDVTRLNFTDKTYTYAWQNSPLAPVTFGVGNGAAGTVTLGSNINVSDITFAATGSGNYTIAGDSAGNYSFSLQTSGSTITTNASATISAPMTDATAGSSSLIKAGTATLTLSGVNSYTGGTRINAGTLALSGSGTLGAMASALGLNNSGSVLDLGGTKQIVGSFNGAAGTVVTNNGTTAGTLTVGTAVIGNGGTFAGVLQNGTSTLALAKEGIGTVTLSGANTYGGGTTISGGTLALASGGSIGTGGLIFNGTGALDLGVNNLTIPSLTAGTTTSAFSGNVTGGRLTLSGASSFSFAPANITATSALDLAGLTGFAYSQAASGQTFAVAVGTSNNSAASTTLNLANGASGNSITVSNLNVGTNNIGVGNIGTLNLGNSNTINTNAVQLGGYRSNGGTVQFNATSGEAVGANAALTLRNVAGGVTPVSSLTIGLVQSGAGTNTAVFDTSAGMIDAIVNSVYVSNVGTSTPGSVQSGTLKVGIGTFNAGAIFLAYTAQSNVSATTNTATFTQNAGAVLTNALTFAQNAGTTPGTALTTTAVYNLGTSSTTALLSAATINVGTASSTASRETLNFNNGTISNYDNTANGFAGQGNANGSTTTNVQNLVIQGLTGGGSGNNNTTLTINLANTGTHTFFAGTGSTITVANTALITGSGSLTKAGGGGMTLAGTANHTGTTAVSAGALYVNGAMTGTAGVTVSGGGTLGGIGTITTGGNGGVTVSAGGTLSPGAAGTGSVGMLTFALGTGMLDVSAATSANSRVFAFDLGTVAASDSIRLSSGTFNLGVGTLGLNDFAITALTGYGPGTYTLLSSTSAINPLALDPTNLVGMMNGQLSTLSFNTNDTALLLIVTGIVPEPGTWAMLASGAVLSALFALRRMRV